MPSTKAVAVIGANFGDEGKGLVVDALVHQHKSPLVVRFNGGSQAGHTVQLSDGTRHVFAHIGAGALAGAATYLSRHFIVNPARFLEEKTALDKLKISDRAGLVFVDRNALVTSPWDQILNQFQEVGRGPKKHGSCGIGIGETVRRQKVDWLLFQVKDLLDARTLSQKLSSLATWFSHRLWELRESGAFEHLTDGEHKQLKLYLKSPQEIAEGFTLDIKAFLKHVVVVGTGASKLPEISEGPVIFEGAQGLLLDETLYTPEYPYVSWSRTGLHNVVDVCEQEKWELDEAIFVTRHYMTRHGNGPFWGEGKWVGKVEDYTNVTHKWQGAMRTGLLCWEQLHKRMRQEMADPGVSNDTKYSLAVTHCDTITFPYKAHCGDDMIEVAEEDFASDVKMGKDCLYLSSGPTRDTFEKVV